VKSKRLEIYVRVSTTDHDTEVKESELREYVESCGNLLEIAEQCQALGVDLVSLRQNIDTTMPTGRLTFQILGAVAEFEREMLRERVRAGMAQARRTGKRMGRPALRCFTALDVD